jgi:regulator of chromosome condensation
LSTNQAATEAPSAVAGATTTTTNGSISSTAQILENTRTRTKPGYVLAVGENLSNQLGFGLEVDSRKKPQLVKQLECNGKIVQVASGGMHSACLTEDGIVYTFGCNDEFALGRANEDDIEKVDLPEKSIEITAGDSHTAALSETGVVYAWGTFRVSDFSYK